MTNLAIRGHATRGKEVIEILEMLGGNNQNNVYSGKDTFHYYFIDNETGYIKTKLYTDDCWTKLTYNIFTLEEFLEKFPYKVGDRVRIAEYESEVRISKMYWDGNEVQYEVVTDEVEWYSAKELNEFNEPNKEKKINQMSLVNCDLDEVEIVLGDKFELKIREGKYYAIKKKLYYPKTYEECCDVLNIPNDERYVDIDVPLDYNELLSAFTKLLICRKAYWKIAGERMGLGKPWEPDLENEELYCIQNYNNQIVKSKTNTAFNKILIFPTEEEMRDVFRENFDKELEMCKELL